MNDFADKLRHWRESMGLTQQQLADLSQVAFNTISELERRKTLRPRMSTAKSLADALRLEAEERADFLEAARSGSVPSADAAPGSGTAVAAARAQIERVTPRLLRRNIASFTGREAEVARLAAAASQQPGAAGVVRIVVIEGMGGIGKTVLALHAAHLIADDFPDGQIFLDLQGYTPGVRRMSPNRALRSMLHALGAPEHLIPQELTGRADLYRSLLAGTRTLIILDNAADLSQVEPLLPAASGCLVVITSRRSLGPLEDAQTIRLEPLPAPEAISLLRTIASQGKFSPDEADAAKIVRLCGYLPLAIRIIGSQLARRRQPDTGEVIAELSRERDRLGHLADEKQSVTAVFEVSFRHLPADAQRMFASLGLIPGQDFDSYTAASLAADADSKAVRSRLRTLVDHNLLIDDVPGRFRLHDLVRDFAQVKSATAEDGALDRLLDFYLHCAQNADGHLERRIPSVAPRRHPRVPSASPVLATPAQARAWFAVEARNLEDAIRAVAGSRPRYAVALSFAIAEYLRAHGPWRTASDLHRMALSVATRLGDHTARAAALVYLGVIERQQGSLTEAERTLSRAVATCPAGTGLTSGGALIELGIAQRLGGRASAASQTFQSALRSYEAAGSVLGQAGALRELAAAQFQLGEFESAEESLSAAFPLYRQVGSHFGEAGTLAYLGSVRMAIKDYAGASQALNGAFLIYQALDDRICQANCLLFLGRAQQETDQRDSAQDTLKRALLLYDELGDRRGVAGALAFLGEAQRAAGEIPLADESLSAAVRIFREVRDPGGEAEALNLHAALTLARGTAPLAREGYAQALRVARAIPSGKDQADALAGLADCNSAEGRTAAARRNYHRALTLYQAMKCDADAARVTGLLAAL